MHENLRTLLDAAKITARDNLNDQEGFTPFGWVWVGEAIQPVIREDPEDGAEKDFNWLQKMLAIEAAKGSFKAVILCSMSVISIDKVGEMVPSLYAVAELETGETIEIMIPYKKIDGKYEFADEMVNERGSVFFSK